MVSSCLKIFFLPSLCSVYCSLSVVSSMADGAQEVKYIAIHLLNITRTGVSVIRKKIENAFKLKAC